MTRPTSSVPAKTVPPKPGWRRRLPDLRPVKHRWASLVSGAVLLLGAVGLVLAAVFANGFPVNHVDLNDGGVWVTSDKDGLFGRQNLPAQSIDAAFNPPGKARSSYTLDVLQQGSAVAAWDRGSGKLYPVDVTNGRTVGTQGLSLPGSAAIQLSGGTLAVLDTKSGNVWALRVDPSKNLPGLGALDATTKPLASVGATELGADQQVSTGAPAAAGPDAKAALAVGVDGSIYAVAATGKLVTIRPTDGGFAAPVYTDLGHAVAQGQITAVGDQYVVLDAASGQLTLPGGRQASIGAPASGATPALQWSGAAADTVLMATSGALLSVSLGNGDVGKLFDRMSGQPTAPLRLAGCVYTAWAGGQGGYARGCGVAVMAKVVLPKQEILVEPQFRVNRGAVILNDLRSGAVYDLLANSRVDNWSSVKPPPDPDPLKNNDSKADPQALLNQPPKALEDNLGARPGRTTLLHVLDNDSDPAGSILSISAITAPSISSVTLAIAPDGQTVAITLPSGATGSVHFTYTVDDGRNSAQAPVTVQVRTQGQNETPKLRPGYIAPQRTVASGGRLSMPVLADWRDFDGDPIALLDAKVPAGSVVARPDGSIDFTAPITGGVQRITYRVSDGLGEPTTSTIDVKVLDPAATTKVAPTALPDVARGQVGQPIIVHPLDNDLPGTDPGNPTAKLALAGDVGSQRDLVVVTNLQTGTVVVTAARPGPYFLDYTLSFGNAAFAKGSIRVDVVPAPASPAPPVAMPDSVVLHGQTASTVDVLANDFDPAGGILVVLNAAPVDPNAQVQVAVVDGQWLRINSLGAASSIPAIVRYTISDGLTAPATGEVTVSRLPDAGDTRPVAVDDYATVRAGDAVTVAVVDNDTNPGGAPMTLAANVQGARSPGQLPVVAPNGGETGTAYVTGNLVRYLAPQSVAASQPVIVDYVVSNAAGDQAVGHLHVTVTPAPSATTPNHPPAPAPVESRAVSGQTVTITVPITGVDIDGDPVSVVGITTAPKLGRILGTSATAITYQAFPTSSGTDTFTYEVADQFGGKGSAAVRVGVTPPGSPQPPVAADDQVTASPGAHLHIDVLANDLRTADDVVTILPLADRNPSLPPGASLASPTGPIDLVAPGLTGRPLVLVYAITDGIGEPSLATVTVRTQADYDVPPVAYDVFAHAEAAATSVTVDVLSHTVDPDGDGTGLTVTKVSDPKGSISGGNVTLPVAGAPRVVTFEVKDAGGATALGLIHVSSVDAGPPYARPGATITIGKNSSKSVDIKDYVVDPAGKPVRLTTTDKIWSAPPTGLTVANQGDTALALTSVGDYVGPAAISFEVTDGATLTDPAGRLSVITIPVQVGPETPVLHCPSEPLTVIEGGAVVNVDVSTVCHVWVANPATFGDLKYTATWKSAADGVTLGGSGTRTLTLAADSAAKPGTNGTITVSVAGTAATPSLLPITVVPAAIPAVSPVVVDGIKAGDSTTVDMRSYVRSPLRDPVIGVVAVAHDAGMAGTATSSGSTVTLNPDPASHGEMTFIVTVTDVKDTARTDRYAIGKITLHVLGVPDAPGQPTIGATVLSKSVQLAWPTPENNGAPIDVYEVSWAGGKQSCPGSPCLITGLVNGSSYTFTVRAHNLVGWSQPSGASPAAVPNTVPGSVTGLTTGNPQDGTLNLTWVAPPNEGTPVTHYDVSWSNGGSASSNGTSLTATGLINDTQYTFTVVAVNALGAGPAAQVQGQSAGAPPQPTAPTFQAVNSANASTRAVTVSWAAVDPNGPGPTTYTLVRTGAGTATICANVTATSCPDDGIANDGTVYTYTLTAKNAVGHTSTASPGAQMEATATPEPITNFSVSPTGADGQALLTFDAPASHGRTSTVTCTWNGNNCGTWSYPVTGQSGATRTITGLPNGQSVNVNLQDCNGSAGGAGAGTPCDPVVSRVVTTYGQMNSLSIVINDHSGPAVTFTVSVNPNGKPATVRVQSAGRDTSFATGVGSGSWQFTDNIGYSATDNITVTVSDPGRTTLSQSTSSSTPPPPPTVTVSKGAPCGGGGGAACSGGTCTASACGYIHVKTANFSSSVTCSFNSQHGSGGFVNETYAANDNKDSYDWYGYSGEWVQVTCNGVASNMYTWP